MKLADFNRMASHKMGQVLMDCCHCVGWASRVSDNAPFESFESLRQICEEVWSQATEPEILEAFSGHPQIGDLQALRNKYASSASAEQGQVADADETVLLDLQAANERYRLKFGFIFIVCATGKSATEMLDLLNARIDNTRQQELVNGAREQGAILQLRLNRLFESSTQE